MGTKVEALEAKLLKRDEEIRLLKERVDELGRKLGIHITKANKFDELQPAITAVHGWGNFKRLVLEFAEEQSANK